MLKGFAPAKALSPGHPDGVLQYISSDDAASDEDVSIPSEQQKELQAQLQVHQKMAAVKSEKKRQKGNGQLVTGDGGSRSYQSPEGR